MDILPAIKSSSEIYGKITSISSLHNITISGCLGDQQAALVGQMCFDKGSGKNTYGTGAFLLVNTGKDLIKTNDFLTTIAYQLGANHDIIYALEGSIAVCGSAVTWFRDQMKAITDVSEIESMALQVDDNAGAYFIPAFSGLLAPHWQPQAKGILVGLTQYFNINHFARAILESCAYQIKDIIHAMSLYDYQLNTLKVDGGMTKNNFLLQFQADILNIPIERAIIAESTALGATMAAGLAVQFWSSIDDIKQCFLHNQSTTATMFYPTMSSSLRQQNYNGWKKALTKKLLKHLIYLI